MLFKRFLKVISVYLPGDGLSGKEEALSKLNPDKFYLENVRSVLGVSHRGALKLCDSAVRQGFFSRRIEVMCPDGAVAASADSEEQLPAFVRCLSKDDDHFEEVELPTKTLCKITAYSLNDAATAILHRQTA